MQHTGRPFAFLDTTVGQSVRGRIFGNLLFSVWFLLGALITPALYAEESAVTETRVLSVNIYGYPYQVALDANERLQVEGVAEEGLHYRGKLVGQEDSWARLSQIDGHWQGVVSLAGELYVVNPTLSARVTTTSETPAVAGASDASGPAVAEATVATLEALPAAETGNARCAMSAQASMFGPFKDTASAMQLQGDSAMFRPRAQQVVYSQLCASTVGGVCLLAELEVVVDQQFQQRLSTAGLDTEAQVLAMINIVEGYYRNDFNIAFDTLRVELLTSEVFTTTDDAADLLDDISVKRFNRLLAFDNNIRAIMHLLTGREFAGGTAGIAYLETLCREAVATGTTQLLESFSGLNLPLTALVMAHEIGHNFGAFHDGDGNSCGAGFVMAGTLAPSATNFSSCSISSIQNHIGSVNNPGLCASYPIDVGIAAVADNPAQVDADSTFTLSYDLQADRAFQSIGSLLVTGSVPAGQGQFQSVRLNGLGCSLAADALSYQCQLSSPPDTASLVVEAIAATELDGAESSFSHQASVANTSDVLDINQANDQAVSRVIVNLQEQEPEVTPEPEPAPPVRRSGGGGGGAIGWSLLLVLLVLAVARRQSYR